MPTIVKRVSLAAAGATGDENTNVLQGSPFEFLPYNAAIRVGMSTDATGVLATVTSGADVLQEEGPVQVGTINVAPKFPDDFLLEDAAKAGDRLAIKCRNTTAAARVVMIVVQIGQLN